MAAAHRQRAGGAANLLHGLSLQRSLEARFARLIAGDGDDAQALPGCTWAVFARGRAIEAGAVGFADPIAQRPLRADTPMRVASISKIATALVVLQLADSGRLSLDADLSDALGFALRNPAHPDAPITARQLLSHTSSMRDGEVYWAGLGERMADFFTPGAAYWEDGGHWSADAPGARFAYCNLGFGVLATLVERVENTRFDLVARERLIGPLGLSGGFNWSGASEATVARGAPVWRRIDGAWAGQVDDPLPIGRTPTFLNPSALDLSSYTLGDNGALFSPQGGLRASVLDLVRLGWLLMGPAAPFLTPETLAAMRTPHWRLAGDNGDSEDGYWRAYGLGLQVLEPGDGSSIEGQTAALIGHPGDAYGLRGGLWLDPTRARGFAFLFNGGPDDPVRAPGVRSAFLRSEEQAMQALYEAMA